MFRILTRADVLLFIALIVTGIGSLIYSGKAVAADIAESDHIVRITVANEKYGEYPLEQDNEITITRHPDDNSVCINIIEIKDGSVWMRQSNCKNQVCVQDGRIDTVGQQIVCLPNRIVIEIIGNESEKEFDAIAQ